MSEIDRTHRMILRDSYEKIQDRSKRAMRNIMIDVTNFLLSSESRETLRLFDIRTRLRLLSDHSIAPRDSPFRFQLPRPPAHAARISIIIRVLCPPFARQMRACQVRGMIRMILSAQGYERVSFPMSERIHVCSLSLSLSLSLSVCRTDLSAERQPRERENGIASRRARKYNTMKAIFE